MVAVDDYTKFTVLGVLADSSASTMASWFLGAIAAPFGVPARVRVDNGTEFRGHFEVTCRLLKVEIRRIRPHAPWQNGRAERMVRTVKGMLRRVLLHSANANWEKVLPAVMRAINATVARSTGVSPHELFYGEQPRDAASGWAMELDLPEELGDASAKELEAYLH